MKVFALVFLSAILAYASASVLPEVFYDGPIQGEDGKIITLEDVDTDGGSTTSTEFSPIRHRRMTCGRIRIQKRWDFDHSVCVSNCRNQNRKGGFCERGVCRCGKHGRNGSRSKRTGETVPKYVDAVKKGLGTINSIADGVKDTTKVFDKALKDISIIFG